MITSLVLARVVSECLDEKQRKQGSNKMVQSVQVRVTGSSRWKQKERKRRLRPSSKLRKLRSGNHRSQRRRAGERTGVPGRSRRDLRRKQVRPRACVWPRPHKKPLNTAEPPLTE